MKRTQLKRKTTLKSSRTRVKRKKAPTITKLKKQLWELCKGITRKTYGNVCFTCERNGLDGGNWQTGHYLASSICSAELRYHLGNLRPQCYHCNINLSGNTLAFRRRLMKEIDAEYPDLLERMNEETKGQMYREDWYLAKIAEYTTLLSELTKQP